MQNMKDIHKIAFLGDYLPRKCGIATFTSDLRTAIAAKYSDINCEIIPVNDIAEGYDYPPEVRYEIIEEDLTSYLRAADFLNFTNVDILCVQHEFGIYGGVAGSHVLGLLHEVKMPIVTTFHTILQEPNPDQSRVLRELIRLSARLVVMSEKGKKFMVDVYDAPADKIDIIVHGIPDLPFSEPEVYKDEFNVSGKEVLLTFGLLSPNKGIEYALQALPEIIKEYPGIVFIVVGQTHPNLLREEGEVYRLRLERMAKDLGVQKNVVFYNRFVGLEELMRFIGAADIYITPYLTEAQITSGTLAFAFGSGNAVISTPYWHAAELLANGMGVLVPFKNSKAISEGVINLLKDAPLRNSMRENAFEKGRKMIWSQVAQQYMKTFHLASQEHNFNTRKKSVIKTLDEQPRQLPVLKLDHLYRMSDSTGIFQHANFTVPNFSEGYCTDDNARALLLTLMLKHSGHNIPRVNELSATYAAFINYAFDRESKRFRNFMSFDRNWLEKIGSEDSHGQSLWVLGFCMRHGKHESFHKLAAELFEQALTISAEFTSPRAWAFTLIGIGEYLKRLNGDRRASQIREVLTNKLMQRFEDASSDEWVWFEDVVTYANAKLPHALILSGRAMNDNKMLETGLKTLRWLINVQTSENDSFQPIGVNGFYKKGKVRQQFDQQPIEAQATVSACIEAYNATGDDFWVVESYRAFEWFLGRNDLGISLYDATSGGCHDGLHVDRISQNQGCESTLAFLLSLTEMESLQSSLISFKKNPENK